MSKNTSFVAERFGLEFSRGSVDLKRGLVPNVRVVNGRSRNGRKYPPAVLAKHFALYGVGVNVGHHYDPRTMMPTEVPPTARFGRLVNPRVHNNGVNADLRFNPEHEFAQPFGWAVLNDPSQYSFSPLHRVKWKPDRDADGDVVAEAILEVASVDIVSDGGTTATIFESHSRFTREGKLMVPEVDSVLSQLETPGMAAGFLADLFAGLKAKFSPEELAILKAVVGGFAAGDATPPGSDVQGAVQSMADADMAAAAESRRRPCPRSWAGSGRGAASRRWSTAGRGEATPGTGAKRFGHRREGAGEAGVPGVSISATNPVSRVPHVPTAR